MPYRRLPNTDQARIRALKAVTTIRSGKENPITSDLFIEARSFLVKFETAHRYYNQCYDEQKRNSKKNSSNFKRTKLYVSHFIQVLNLAFIRGEFKRKYKSYYQLPEENVLPDLSTETAVVEWGKRIIEGEEKRIMEGGVPIYNPTVAKVKVHYDIFLENNAQQKNYQRLTAKSLEKLSSMRGTADAIILKIWNAVEAAFANIEDAEKRLAKCKEYGVVYYYRTNEKEKMKEQLMYGDN